VCYYWCHNIKRTKKGIQLLEFELEEETTADCLWKHRWLKGKQLCKASLPGETLEGHSCTLLTFPSSLKGPQFHRWAIFDTSHILLVYGNKSLNRKTSGERKKQFT
jgi:hypothetical protein